MIIMMMSACLIDWLPSRQFILLDSVQFLVISSGSMSFVSFFLMGDRNRNDINHSKLGNNIELTLIYLIACNWNITSVFVLNSHRLPIVQGATFAFLAPVFSILNLPKWKCPGEYVTCYLKIYVI